jgi:putative RNA 2'-phosphotransferase
MLIRMSKELSKFMSFALRHNPEEAGIEVDENGWTNISELCEAAREDHGNVTERDIEEVVENDSKGRYELDGNRVRAVYGHSIDVNIDKKAETVPNTLYHGTPENNISSIKKEGLKPMNRNEVHLTDNKESAKDVGKRHSNNIRILRIDTNMVNHNFHKKGKNIYTVKEVPPNAIKNI